MRAETKNLLPFIISVSAAVLATVGVVLYAAVFSNRQLTFDASYYFVCYAIRDNALSADAISTTVSNYGGAGYVLGYDGDFYVTVACYYNESEAETVRQNLLKRGLQCSVLNIKTNEYHFANADAKNGKLFSGNLNTLDSLSRICYECANQLDTGKYSQAEAEAVLEDIEDGLQGLKKANPNNCFTDEIKRLIAECETTKRDYIYSKDMRKLQIAILDCIINIDMG